MRPGAYAYALNWENWTNSSRHTLFPDKAVIAVVRVVRVARRRTSSIAQDLEVELKKLVPEAP
jgi:hypothetical protein